jgi:integrase
MGAIAALCCLPFGFGASEVCLRVGRDVDDGGALMWIDRGKAKNRRRVIEVPE